MSTDAIRVFNLISYSFFHFQFFIFFTITTELKIHQKFNNIALTTLLLCFTGNWKVPVSNPTFPSVRQKFPGDLEFETVIKTIINMKLLGSISPLSYPN